MNSQRSNQRTLIMCVFGILLACVGRSQASVSVETGDLFANGHIRKGNLYFGSCPVDLEIVFGVYRSGESTTEATSVTYTIVRSDGSSSDAQTIDIPPDSSTRSRTIHVPVKYPQFGQNTPEFSNYQGWAEINISAPNQVSQRTRFDVHCEGADGSTSGGLASGGTSSGGSSQYAGPQFTLSYARAPFEEITVSGFKLTRAVSKCISDRPMDDNCIHRKTTSQTAQLGPDELQKLMMLIQSSGFMQLEDSYGNPGRGGRFYPITIALKSGDVQKKVLYQSYPGAGPEPEAFSSVAKMLESLAQEKLAASRP